MGRHDAALLIPEGHESAKSTVIPRGDWSNASYALTNALWWSSSWGALQWLTMAVDLTIQGYFWPVFGLVRFSVRKTGVFSWALPTKSTPSLPTKRLR